MPLIYNRNYNRFKKKVKFMIGHRKEGNMNVVEKILSAHSRNESVEPGEMIDVSLDYIMANDATTSLAIDIFEKEIGAGRIYDPNQVVIVIDHYTPSSSESAADNHNKMRDFCARQQINFMYDGEGVCHQLMLENHVKPGQLIIGADSHTCTYGALGALSTGMGSTDIAIAWSSGKIWMKVPHAIKIVVKGKWPSGVYAKDLILKIIGDLKANGATYKAMVFEGEAIESLGISARATLCNMAIEAGAKFAYIQPDYHVKKYMEAKGRIDFSVYVDDPDAEYKKTLYYDVTHLLPQIAAPYSVDNVFDIIEFEGMKLNALFLGACTNGRYEDIEIAANILRGKKISKSVRFLVTPASRQVYIKALESGLLKDLMESGAMISNPGCSACFGGTVGLLGKGEKLLSTANRNFKGRVGSPFGEIYLANPAVVAASALTGVVTMPNSKE